MTAAGRSKTAPYLSIVEVIGLSWDYLADRWRALIFPALIVFLIFVAYILVLSSFGLKLHNTATWAEIGSEKHISAIVLWIGMQVFMALPVAAISLHLTRHLDGTEMGILTVLGTVLSRAFPIMLCAAIWHVLLTVGIFAALIPACFFIACFGPALQVLVAERAGPLTAYRRCLQLTRGMRWKVFSAVFIITLINGLFNLILFLLGFLLVMAGASEIWVTLLAIMLETAIGWPLMMVMFAALYVELRRQQDGSLPPDEIAAFD